MRLIDGDVAVENIEEWLNSVGTALIGKGLSYTCELMGCIEDAPTINAVPVVRCRECKYWGDEDGKLQDSDGVLFARCKVHNYLIDGRHTGWCPTENDFCSYGERKDGDGNG